jgi:hypothetical protein
MNNNDEESKSSFILTLKDEMNAALIGDDNQNYISSLPIPASECVKTEIIDEDKENNKNRDRVNNILLNYNMNTFSDQLSVTRGLENSKNKHHASEYMKDYVSTTEKNRYDEIESNSKKLIKEINSDTICFWKYENKIYYRKNTKSKINNSSKEDIDEAISRDLDRAIKIIKSKEIVKKDKVSSDKIYDYILNYHIPMVESEIFNPKEKEFFESNNILYKNSFISTKHLMKRFEEYQKTDTIYDGFIINFLEHLTNEIKNDDKNKVLTMAIMNWISYFFQKMESSNIALVMIGDKKITEKIFFEKIIQPIFGIEYCISINDDTLKGSIENIVKNKLFIHIGDITPTQENIKKLNELLHAVFFDRYITESETNERLKIYAQVLITSKDILNFTKDFYNRFEYIETNSLENIVSNLELFDEFDLPHLIENDLDSFSDDLVLFNKNKHENNRLSIVSSMDKFKVEEVVETINTDEQIDNFIRAIKKINIEFFSVLKDLEDKNLYLQLKESLKKGYYIRQDLFNYFKEINKTSIYKSNNELLVRLKDKDEMFRQQVDNLDAVNNEDNIVNLFKAYSTKEFLSNKKLCKIEDYKLERDIIVPKGYFLKNSSPTSDKKEYKYEDLELAKIMYEEYNKAQKNKKEDE